MFIWALGLLVTRVQPEKPCSNCVVISVNIMHAEDVPRQILSLVSMPQGQSSFVSLDTFETVKTVSSEGWIICNSLAAKSLSRLQGCVVLISSLCVKNQTAVCREIKCSRIVS